MAEYIDVEKARAYVETDLKGDPVLQWLGRTMIEKLPKVEAVPVQAINVTIRNKQPVGAKSFCYACHCCEDQGGGNFYCRYAKVMVVKNWQNTPEERICKRMASPRKGPNH